MFYALLDHKWGTPVEGTASGPVTYSVDLSGLNNTNGNSIAAMENVVDQAFQAWEDVAALNFVKSSGGGVDIPITTFDFVDDLILGDAAVPVAPGNLVTPSVVPIRLNDDTSWVPGTDSDPFTQNLFAVTAHEIGHAIGLAHVSDPNALMAEYLRADDLQTGDIGGAQALYGLDGGDVAVDAQEEGAGAPPVDAGSGGAGVLAFCWAGLRCCSVLLLARPQRRPWQRVGKTTMTMSSTIRPRAIMTPLHRAIPAHIRAAPAITGICITRTKPISTTRFTCR